MGFLLYRRHGTSRCSNSWHDDESDGELTHTSSPIGVMTSITSICTFSIAPPKIRVSLECQVALYPHLSERTARYTDGDELSQYSLSCRFTHLPLLPIRYTLPHERVISYITFLLEVVQDVLCLIVHLYRSLAFGSVLTNLLSCRVAFHTIFPPFLNLC